MDESNIYSISKDLAQQCVDYEVTASNIYESLLELHKIVEDYEADIIYTDVKLDFTNNVYKFSREPKSGESFGGVYTRNTIIKLGMYRGTCILNKETNQLEVAIVIEGDTKNETICIKKDGSIWKIK